MNGAVYIPDRALEWRHETTARARPLPARPARARRLHHVEPTHSAGILAARPLSGESARERYPPARFPLLHREPVMAARRVALITGGGRGIGRAIALAFAREGLAVAVAARTRRQVEGTADDARDLGATALAVALDVTEPAAVGTAVPAVARALGPVDVLVNNAGIAESAPFAKTDLDHWERHLRVNVTGPYLLTREVLPGMLERGWGRVVNIASLAGLAGAPYVSAYTASKHALVGLTRALAAEVAGPGGTPEPTCSGRVADPPALSRAPRNPGPTSPTLPA